MVVQIRELPWMTEGYPKLTREAPPRRPRPSWLQACSHGPCRLRVLRKEVNDLITYLISGSVRAGPEATAPMTGQTKN